MTNTLSHSRFIKTLPEVTIPLLPASLQSMHVRQPWGWLVQFHFGEPRLHYEVSRIRRRKDWEIAFHCEARDRNLNRFLLDGFRRHLFEIKDSLGDTIEAEMWDKGWTKIYEVYPGDALTPDYQGMLAKRLVEFITVIHPIFVELRSAVVESYR